jgi:hypothetical protein
MSHPIPTRIISIDADQGAKKERLKRKEDELMLMTRKVCRLLPSAWVA